jgi:serine phosphatase RsbU (regulator of sigma subunit)
MGQLRSAARALLLEGPDPARMISSLDTFAGSIEGGACATVACVIVERSTGEVSYCRAGHPPPLVVGPEGVRWLDASGGPVLGIDPDVERTNTTTTLAPDEVLLMYTDGLIERRNEPIDGQFAVLAELASSIWDRHVTQIANSILLSMDTDRVDDDVVLLVKRLETAD